MSRRVTAGRAFGGLVAGVLLLMVVPASPAAAHNALVGSDPMADAVIAEAPKTITLTFNEDVQDFNPLVAVTVGEATPIEITPNVAGPVVTASLSRLDIPATNGEPVLWRIGYRVVSADGHPVSGIVNFSVGDGQAAQPSSTPVADTVESDGPRTGLIIGIAAGGVIAVALAILWWRRDQRLDD